MNKKDISFRYTKGQGPGEQHKNKTASCVVATHIPTGITVTIDGRNQHHNKRQAIKELERRLNELKQEQKAERKKAERDIKIHDKTRVRTYDFSRGVVTDHRTGKTASLKDILEKGKLEKFYGPTTL